MARNGDEKPICRNDDSEEYRLAVFLSSYTAKNKDPEFNSTLRQLRPDWFLDYTQIKKEKILALAMSGKNKPKRTIFDSEQAELAVALNNYTNKNKNGFDLLFTEKIRNLRPDWFK
jgi:hypothetical protein